MAAAVAFPARFKDVHPKFETPAFGTWVIGIASALWYVIASSYSENFLFDSLSALSLLIAFYYALTGIACAVYWRRRLTSSVKAFLLIGVGPVLGAIMLGYLLVQSTIQLADPEESDTGTAILGMGVPLAIALFFFILGIVLMLGWRFGPGKAFFTRKGGEQVSDEVALAALGPTAPGLGQERTLE
jgi:amino acid transporter